MNLPVVIVLASGRGKRFLASGGTGSKLQAMLAGKPVLQHTLAAVQASGLPWHLEDSGQAGMGDSIAAAVRSTPDAAGWLILPGDLPLIQSQTLLAVAAALQEHGVVLPSYSGQRGHPVGFAADCRQALLELSGEQGALGVVRSRAAFELPVADAGCVHDIDTLDDLRRAESLLLAARQAKTGENG
ncbi:MAG: nucleotidyltransferase family protein [Comamonadaceae bacterium]|nr:MAG: nucleotidyltransferase family protein [Comamonadaceae bacterium]